MKTETIQIVDRGRGPQLSSSRITVQDLVPYFQQSFTHEQIREIMPSLSVEEIAVALAYVKDNYDAVMEQDRRIRERSASRRKPPEIEEAERMELLARLEKARQQIRDTKEESNRGRAAG